MNTHRIATATIRSRERPTSRRPGSGIPDDPDRFSLPDGHYWGPLEGPQESWSNRYGNEPQSSKDGLKRWQATLGIPQTSVYDDATHDAAKTMQQAKGWPVTGHVYAGEWYGVIKDGWRLPARSQQCSPPAHAKSKTRPDPDTPTDSEWPQPISG